MNQREWLEVQVDRTKRLQNLMQAETDRVAEVVGELERELWELDDGPGEPSWFPKPRRQQQ